MNEIFKNNGLTEDVSVPKISGGVVTTEVEIVINESTLDLAEFSENPDDTYMIVVDKSDTTPIDEYADGTEQPGNLFNYMSLLSLTALVAELSAEFLFDGTTGEFEVNEKLDSTVMRIIEQAVWNLDKIIGIYDAVDDIKNIIEDNFYPDVPDVLLMLLRVIGNTRERHGIEFYMARAKELE